MKRWFIVLFIASCPLMLWGQDFHYPTPPDSIRDRAGRVSYMVNHFWNEHVIADTTHFQSPRLLLNYLYLLKQADGEEAGQSINSFVALACKQERTFGLILYWLDQILYDSVSPHYDEALYLRLMDAVLASEADSVMKLLPRERANMLRKNQIGQQANDFTFVDKSGRKRSLYSIKAPLLLLVFNNPECSLCQRTEMLIEQNDSIRALLASGSLKIVAIAPDADRDEWERHHYPAHWIAGYDAEGSIYARRLYDIQRLPSLYLLDKDKRVLLKEGTYERLCKSVMGMH